MKTSQKKLAVKSAVKPAKQVVRKVLVKKTTATKKKAVTAPKPMRQRSKKSLNVTSAAKEQLMDAEVKSANEDAPRIECRLLVGDLSLTVDPSSLERTLGAGRWGHGLGLVDSWPDAAWVGLLAHLKLPADPLDRTVAEQPVKRLVQQLWYGAVNPTVLIDRKDAFAERDADRQEEYKEKFTHVEGVAKGRSERAKTSFGNKGETKYAPTDKLKVKGLVLGGQQAPLLTFFKDAKWAAATSAEATAGMLAHGLKTGTDPKRISGFYLSTWCKKGLLERSVA